MDDVDSELSKLLSSTVLVFAGVLLSAVLGLVERVIIGNAFGVELYGEFSLGLTILSLNTSITVLGLSHGVTRYMSRYEDERDVRGVWLSAAGISLTFSSVVSIALFFNVDGIVALLFEQSESSALLELFVLSIPVSTLLTIAVSAMRGMENTRYKIYARDIFREGSRVVLLLVFVGLGLGIYSTGYAYLLSGLGALVVAFYLLNRLTNIVGPFRFHGRELMHFSVPLMMSTILATLLSRIDTLMIGFFRTSVEVGLYSSAYPLATTLLMAVSCFGYLYLPLTSRLDADGKKKELTKVYQMTTKWSFLLTFPLFAVFLFFSGDILATFFGDEFSSGGTALAILSVGFFVSATLGRNRETLSALGATRSILIADVLALTLNVVLNVLLIPTYGFAGAAFTSAVSFVLRNVYINAVLWLRFEVSPFSSSTARTYLVIPAVVLPLTWVSSLWISLSLVLFPIALVLGGFVVVVVSSVSGCLQSEDLIAIKFIEDATGLPIPYLRRFIQM